MKLSALYQIFLDCAVVTTDSRNCPEGSLFTQKRGVCLVEQLPAAAFVLSLRFRKRQKLDVAARLQTVEDAQAGRPGAAVDKHLFHRDPSTAGATRLFDATNIHYHA